MINKYQLVRQIGLEKVNTMVFTQHQVHKQMIKQQKGRQKGLENQQKGRQLGLENQQKGRQLGWKNKDDQNTKQEKQETNLLKKTANGKQKGLEKRRQLGWKKTKRHADQKEN